MSRIYIDDNYCLARPVKIFYFHKFGSWEKRDASYEVGVDICWEWLYPGNRNSSMQTSLFFGLTLWTILMHYQIIYLANKIVKMLATVSCRIKWVALISCFDFSFRFVFCRIPLWTFQFLRPFRSFKTDVKNARGCLPEVLKRAPKKVPRLFCRERKVYLRSQLKGMAKDN